MSLLLTIALAHLAAGCRKGAGPPGGASDPPAEGEPEQYSATLVQTVEDGERREVSETVVFRSGEKLRQEWLEGGKPRAIIWRPDLGKVFLLAIDRRVYTEQELSPGSAPEAAARPRGGGEAGRDSAALSGPPMIEPDAIDRVFKEAAPPDSVETRALPDQVIDGFNCAVFERRSRFADGRVELTRWFRARELSGLALRIETETVEAGAAVPRLRVVTERRNVQTELPPDGFRVPPDFKKVGEITVR
jgi:hypothetical protein